jgi:hypothetical protein
MQQWDKGHQWARVGSARLVGEVHTFLQHDMNTYGGHGKRYVWAHVSIRTYTHIPLYRIIQTW